MWLFVPGLSEELQRAPESAGLSLDSSSPSDADIQFHLILSGKAVQRPRSWHGWKTRPWMRPLFTAPSNPFQANSLVTAKWLPQEYRASPSAVQASIEVSQTNDGFGPTSSGMSFAQWNPRSSSWSASQISLIEDSQSSSPTFTESGTMRNGACTERMQTQSSPRIAGKGSSYSHGMYPTPAASHYGTSQNEGTVRHKRPSAGTPSLETWAKTLWHTQMSGDAKGAAPNQNVKSLGRDVRRWATPTARDATAAGSRNTKNSKAHSGISLSDMVITGSSTSGRLDLTTPKGGKNGSPKAGLRQRRQLNPEFVEALQGFPKNFSSLATGSTVSATQWSQWSQRMRSRISQGGQG